MFVRVIKPFKYRGKELKSGEVLEVSHSLANKLAESGFVVGSTQEEFKKAKEDYSKDNKDLSNKKVDELKEIAKELGIDGFESLKKQELIDAIKQEQNKD